MKALLALLAFCREAGGPGMGTGTSRGCIQDHAKLSDAQINTVGRAKVFRFVTPARAARVHPDGSIVAAAQRNNFYIRTRRPYNDSAEAMGLMPLQFLSVTMDTTNLTGGAMMKSAGCSGRRANSSCAFATDDCGVLRNVFWDMDGSGPGCASYTAATHSGNLRCFNEGRECGGGMVQNAELWVRSAEPPGTAREYPHSCINAPLALLAVQNVTLRPRGVAALFAAICDREGFMKVLQTHTSAYAPTAEAVNAAALRQTPCQLHASDGGAGAGSGTGAALTHHPSLAQACDRCEGREVWAYGLAAAVALGTFCCTFSVVLVTEQRWEIDMDPARVGAACVFVFGFVCLSFFWACVDQDVSQERYFYPTILMLGLCGLSTVSDFVLKMMNFALKMMNFAFKMNGLCITNDFGRWCCPSGISRQTRGTLCDFLSTFRLFLSTLIKTS